MSLRNGSQSVIVNLTLEPRAEANAPFISSGTNTNVCSRPQCCLFSPMAMSR